MITENTNEPTTIKKGLVVDRVFSTQGVDPFDQKEWEMRSAEITDSKGNIVFKQENIEVPKDWSILATKIAASKYFHGDIKNGNDPYKGGRESSIKQLITRVCKTIAEFGKKDGYFAADEDAEAFQDELAWLCVNQYGAFNSPVWFNVGVYHEYGFGKNSSEGNYVYLRGSRNLTSPGDSYRAKTQYENPQGSACFLLSVQDNMESIMDLGRAEAMLFKFGSGAGTNLSTLRSSKEFLSGGGRPSGPMSFLRVYDAIAGTVKSGGKTRRAAKLNCLNYNHGDIIEFVDAKQHEEQKAWALIDAGYSGDFNGEAYASVLFQNENLSVRVSDEFMEKAQFPENDERGLYDTIAVTDGRKLERVHARTVLRKMSEGTHLCGDPGIQYNTTINKWHTCPASDEQRTTNPCCLVGDTLVSTPEGHISIERLQEMDAQGLELPLACSFCFERSLPVYRPIKRAWIAGETKKLIEVRTDKALVVCCTPEHKFYLYDGTAVEARDLTPGVRLRTFDDEAKEFVQSITAIELDSPVKVYDIEVEETHNFGVITPGNIHSIIISNSEYSFINDTACISHETRVSTDKGLESIEAAFARQQRGEQVFVFTDIFSENDHRNLGALRPATVIQTGEKEVFVIVTNDGRKIRATADHKFLTKEGWKRVDQLECGFDQILVRGTSQNFKALTEEEAMRWRLLGYLSGDGCFSKGNISINFSGDKIEAMDVLVAELEKMKQEAYDLYGDNQNLKKESTPSFGADDQQYDVVSKSQCLVRMLEERYGMTQNTSIHKAVPSSVFTAGFGAYAAYLQGLFLADASIRKAAGTEKEVMLASSAPELIRGVQLMLGELGIGSRISWFHPEGRANPQGQLHITNNQQRKFHALIGFISGKYKEESLSILNSSFAAAEHGLRPAKVTSITSDGVAMVYDINEPVTHSFVAEGLIVHNCNLASLNLLKFKTSTGFDVEKFKAAVRIFITAQEIIVDNASYPTHEIAVNSHIFRTLGLGYANIGALIMSMGLGYDSNEGRALAGAITALMGGEAYAQSGRIAEAMGAFPGLDDPRFVSHVKPSGQTNRNAMTSVMVMHLEHAEVLPDLPVCTDIRKEAIASWKNAVTFSATAGWRNAQVTVLAPTGCCTEDTLVLTNKGLKRIASLGNPEGEQWQDVSFMVQTDEGDKRATKFYVNGLDTVVRIETDRGYSFRATPSHRIKVVNPETGSWDWVHMCDVKEGMLLPIKLGGMLGSPIQVGLSKLTDLYKTASKIKVPEYMNAELAEFIGWFMANGSLHQRGLRLTVDFKDPDVKDLIKTAAYNLFDIQATEEDSVGCWNINVNSVELSRWWIRCGFAKTKPEDATWSGGKGWNAHIPDAILSTNDENVYAAFVRGVMELDGSVESGMPTVTNKSRKFVNDLKVMLLALGMPSSLRSNIGGLSGKPVYKIRLANVGFRNTWKSLIGFRGERKSGSLMENQSQSGKRDIIPMTREMVEATFAIDTTERHSALTSLTRNGGVSRDLILRSGVILSKEVLHLMEYFYDTVELVEMGEEELTYDISVPENVTYIANGLVSHNTIGFLMDCATTGIEPDIALVKYKLLAGGGNLKLVNDTVDQALVTLGYNEQQRHDISRHIEKYDTIEDVAENGSIVHSGLAPEHLHVFDCAFKAQNGSRSLGHMGHLKMMAAAQPFLSGAISKTVNLPEHSTVEDIMDTYIEGWKLGLKAVAIYRDGSKRSAPLTTKKDTPSDTAVEAAQMAADSIDVDHRIKQLQDQVSTLEAAHGKPVRKKMPETRPSVTHAFNVSGHKGYLSVGLFDNGQPGELFITMNKEGSTIGGLMDSVATLTSISLQYGVPLDSLVRKFAYQRFEPSGFTQNKDVRNATSLVDYIFRWMACQFIPGYREEHAPKPHGVVETSVIEEKSQEEAPAITVKPSRQSQYLPDPCSNCGSSKVVRAGACGVCQECATSQGCS